MEETAVVTTGATNADETAGWNDAGWDDAAAKAESAAENPAEGAEPVQAEGAAAPESAAKEGETEKPAEESAEEGKAGSGAPNQEQRPTPETLRIKYMDQEREISRDEAVQLAQKGMDYDRIREKWDDARETITFIDEQAKAAGMDRKSFIDYLRIESKKSQGMSEDDAKRTVELENREAAVQLRESEEQQRIADQQAQQNAADTERERRDADFRRFAEKYPDLKVETITEAIPDVWERVGKGESLVEIWQDHEINRLKTEQAAEAQNVKNAGRSTGSMASSGGETQKKDPFDEGWD